MWRIDLALRWVLTSRRRRTTRGRAPGTAISRLQSIGTVVQPSSRAGLELLAHELTHVAQLQSGQALGVSGPVSQPGDPVEAAADRTAATVAAGGALAPAVVQDPSATTGPAGAHVAPRSAVFRTPPEAATPAPPAEPGDVIVGWVGYETEARRGGTLAWRNNNPGNIRPGAFATNHGAYAGKRSGGFAVFPTYEQGFLAIKALLRTSRYSPLTISAAIAIYAPSNDSNDPVAYAATISRRTGLDATRTIDSLSDTELDAVAQAIRAVEGYVVGTTLPRTDTTLPARVQVTASSSEWPGYATIVSCLRRSVPVSRAASSSERLTA